MINKVDFFGNTVTRLILGDNPINGHSYIPEIYPGSEMLDYYTADNAVNAMLEAERCGINTCMLLANDFMLRVIRQFRNQGGKMNIIFQPYPAIDLKINLRMMLEADPIAIYHQGTTTDNLCETDQIEKLRDNIKMIKDSGVPAGLGTHVPETILRSEDEDWGVDFYMSCLYNARRNNRGEESGFITGKSKNLKFYPNDKYLMFDVIQKVQKPFIVIKVLAGGQVFYNVPAEEYPQVTENAFREAYEKIKPSDVVCMGVHQKHKNQIKENTDIVKSLLK